MNLHVARALAGLGVLACLSSPAAAGPVKPAGPCSGVSGTVQTLLERSVTLPSERLALHVVVEKLHAARVPISFVDARAEDLEEPLVALSAAGSLESALTMLLGQAGSYRCGVLDGHLVLYPSLAKYEQRVRGVDIVRLPRIQAAWKYTEWLNTHASGFEDLISQPLRGYPYAPLYAEPVTLQPEARVIDHLMQLLGSNPNVVFVVERPCLGGTCRGARLWLSELRAAPVGAP